MYLTNMGYKERSDSARILAKKGKYVYIYAYIYEYIYMLKKIDFFKNK